MQKQSVENYSNYIYVMRTHELKFEIKLKRNGMAFFVKSQQFCAFHVKYLIQNANPAAFLVSVSLIQYANF